MQSPRPSTMMFSAVLLMLSLTAATISAQAPKKQPAAKGTQATSKQAPDETSSEELTDRAMEVLGERPTMLYRFLVGMPKGADLHNHLSGAVYAESWIRAGAEDNLCVNVAALAFAKSEGMTKSIAPQPVCGDGKLPVAQAFKDQHLYDALVDSFSMRSFVPSAGVSGHDHFFDSFSKFGGTDKRHMGEWLDEVATRAAAQNEQYLELMETPDFSHAAAIAREVSWQDDFAHFRDALLARGLREDVAPALIHLDQSEALRRQRERCGQADAAPACKVEIRFLYQVLRGFPKEQVFAQTLLGFETASADPRFVGINFVMPEDGYTSMTDYSLQMKMVGYLHSVYPKVHISLHAGEIAPGLVPYEGLCCHIRLAVEEAHAERIGHGVDIMYEDRPYQLLREMAQKHVMVEINLTSNDMILGVSGEDHPLAIYRHFGVPVALSTDDEGVSRINLTHEYFRAVRDYGFDYPELKTLARTSLEHCFLPGTSLWKNPDVFSDATEACAKDTLGGEKPSAGCAAFLKSSEKAQQQWELERRLRDFEAKEHLHIGDDAKSGMN